MPTTRSWLGGGNNRTSNSLDWSPSGLPQPGDSLVTGYPGGPATYTMNIRGNELAGDLLYTSTYGALTANLSHTASVSAQVSFGAATFNVSHSSLTVGVFHGNATINLSNNSALNLSPGYGITTVHVTGNDTVSMQPDTSPGSASFILAPFARLSGTLVSPSGSGGLSLTGGVGSAFNNNGNSSFNLPGSSLGVDVTGRGTITVASENRFGSGLYGLEFLKSVGPHQSISNGGQILLEEPTEFSARMTLTSVYSEVDLAGLATADSYTFAKDMLSIFSGGSIIDSMRLTDNTPYGFDVVKAAGSVDLVALSSTGESLQGALPVHVGA